MSHLSIRQVPRQAPMQTLARRRFRRALSRVALTLVWAVSISASAAGDAAGPKGYPGLAVKAGGPLEQPAVRAHLEFSLDAGFRRVWLPCQQFGGDCLAEAAFPPPAATAALCERLRQGDGRLLLVLAAERLSGLLKDKAGKAQLTSAARRFAASCPADWVVLAGPDPIAAAQATQGLDRATRKARGDAALWFHPGFGWKPGDPARRRAAGKRAGLIVRGSAEAWPTTVAAAGKAWGTKRVMLEEPYPGNGDVADLGLAVHLGPIRRRELPRLDGYLVSPSLHHLGASRVSLLSAVGLFQGKEIETSWQDALARLAGEDKAAWDALRTQAVEWGGWYDERNYRPLESNRVEAACATLRDPAALAAYSWTRKRYADRIWAMRNLADGALRDDLTRVMRRRLAVALALPVIRSLTRPRPEEQYTPDQLYTELRNQRGALAAHPDAQAVFDRLLETCGVPLVGVREEPPNRSERDDP